jgi:hypothetical protein
LAGSWRLSPPPLRLSPEDLTEATPLLVSSGAGALGWWRVRHSELRKAPAAHQLQEAYRQNAVCGALQERRIEDVVAVLKGAGVTPILVKGWTAARLYPNPALRFPGDIDLMLRPPDLKRVREALERRPVLISEVDTWHEELDSFSERAWDGLYARAQVVRLGETDVQVLGPEDQLAFLCMHFLRHGAWRPIWLCDIGVALETRPPSFNWELCLGGGWGRADWIACALGLAHVLLSADVRETPVAQRATHLPGWLAPRVLKHWERPLPRQHDPPDLIRTALRRPSAVPSALRARWPDPIQATIRANGPFNGLPRLPFQIWEYSRLARHFLVRLPHPPTGSE